MNSEEKEETDWALDAFSSAISSFFIRKVPGEEGKALANLAGELARQAGCGASYLTLTQAEEIFENWSELPAVGHDSENLPLVRTRDKKLYFRRYYEYEKQVADTLGKRLIKENGERSSEEWDNDLFQSLDERQVLAVKTALRKDLLLLTGGPGTGKTRTIVAIILAVLQRNANSSIALAAPTGKAAFRMRESILSSLESFGLEDSLRLALLECSRSTTLHRLLGTKFGSVDFLRNQDNPLHHDLVIIDEASMVDLPLMSKLCASLRDETKLVLVGDADQLSPVQGGAVFNGLIKAPKAESYLADSLVRLATNHRRSISRSSSALSELCDAVRDGKAEEALALAKSGTESIRFIENLNDPSIDQAIRACFDSLTNADSPDSALSAIGNFRILCPHNQGHFGVENWNRRADNLLPSGEFNPSPVIVGVNDYSIGLFNGDDGVLMGKKAYFSADEGTREVSRSRLPDHRAGYASSIHRSQGSEFEEVMIILPPAEAKLLTRELLYVGVSRAKRSVTIVGNADALKAAVERSEKVSSGVLDMIESSYGKRMK